ncbi:AAA family ATPase [Planosporangium thailandense]|uniref:AAA family ATPase n=1 Tax=Planosporangium thailandense TaxID=765197 RepID=UPI00197C619C
MQTISTQPDVLSVDAAALRDAVTRARAGLVDREVVAEVVVLCAVAGEHLLVIGAPGTAKSEAVRRTAGQLGGRYFEYLLGRFTEPNEIFGSVDLRRLRDGVVEFETAGMLPEAEVAFLDEVFLGSTAVLNTLLGILNERAFRRGSTLLSCPLRICVGAANTLPDDPALAAFADRFLARIFVTPVPDAQLDELLEVGWAAGSCPANPPGSLLPALDRLTEAARGCDLSGIRGLLGTAIRRLRQAGVPLSDRRVVRSQRLVAAAAALDGRTEASSDDLWVLPRFDGALLTVVDDDGIAFIDLGDATPRIAWRELDSTVEVLHIDRSPTSLAALVRVTDPLSIGEASTQVWRWDLPSLMLRSRQPVNVDGIAAVAVLASATLLTTTHDQNTDTYDVTGHRSGPWTTNTEPTLLASGGVFGLRVEEPDRTTVEIPDSNLRVVFPATVAGIGVRRHADTLTLWDQAGRLVAVDLSQRQPIARLRTRL